MRGRSSWGLLLLALLTVAAIVAIWALLPVKYQARAYIQISPIIPYLVFQTEDTGLIPLYDSYVNTQVNVIRSPKVLQRVLERQDVQATQWYRDPRPSLMERLRGDQVPRIERLREGLVVRPRFKTEITDVMMEDPVPQDARVIVQAVVEEYERYAGTQSDEKRDDFNRKLAGEYTRLQKEVEDWEKICFGIQEELGTGDPDRLLSNKAIALDEEKAALAAIRQEIVAIQMQINKAGGVGPNEQRKVEVAEELKRQPKYYTDAKWSRLDAAAKRARHAITTYPFKPSDPNTLKLLELDLKFAVELLRERETQLDEQWLLALSALPSDPNNLTPEQRLEYSQNQLEILREQAKVMNDGLNKKQEEYNRLFAKSQELKRETATLQHKRALFAAVQARKDAKDMEREVRGRISVLGPAAASFTPHNDRRVVYTGIALLVCVVLTSGMARGRWKRWHNATKSQ